MDKTKTSKSVSIKNNHPKTSRPKLPGQVINRMDAHEYETTIQDLLERIDILEGRIRMQNYEKLDMEEKNKAMGGMNEKLNRNLTLKINEAQKLQKEKDNCDKKIKDLNNCNKLLADTNKEKTDYYNDELEKKRKELDKAKNDIKGKNEELKKEKLLNELTQNYYNSNKNELDKQKKLNNKQQKKIYDLNNEITDLNIKKRLQDALLAENDHLKSDNLKLLEIINDLKKDDKGYTFLGQTYTGGVRFITPIEEKNNFDKNKKNIGFQRAKSARSNKCRGCPKNCVNIQEIDKQNWIPIEAFNVANQYKIKCNLNISDEDIENLLYELNKVWQIKFRKEINHVKNVYQNEIKDLRSKLESRKPYNQFMDKKIIDNLKKTLRDTRDTLRDNIISKYKLFESPAAVVSNDFSKNAKNFRNDKRKSQGIKFPNNDMEFNYGVLYLSEKVFNEMNILENNINDLFNMYRDKVNNLNNYKAGVNNNFYIEVFNSSISWFFDSVKEAIENYRDKISEFKSDAQRNLKM